MDDDVVDEMLRQFRADAIADIDRRVALLSQRLRASRAQAAARPNDQRLKLIALGEAAKLAGISKVRMRAVCAERLHGSDGGFGYKRGSRWHVVDDDLFRGWLRRRASV